VVLVPANVGLGCRNSENNLEGELLEVDGVDGVNYGMME
jgi:hypothetical protein